MIKFLPSYVGSKAFWVGRLDSFLDNRIIAEPFAGSAVLSANYAKSAWLNDYDKYVYRILNEFDKQIVPDEFFQADYFIVRSRSNWWRYAYCLQKMSFSGVFRWSKNGYNVPVKKNIKSIQVRSEYEIALTRWRELSPFVSYGTYLNMYFPGEALVILDPPYEGSQASYNLGFNSNEYWRWVSSLDNDLMIFDRAFNLTTKNIPVYQTRNMRVNGKYDGDIEAVAIRIDGIWRTQ